jgi:WD40 repeat protein
MNMAAPVLGVADKDQAAGVIRVFGEARFHADGDILGLAFDTDNSLWSIEDPGVLRRWGPGGQVLASQHLSDLETLWAFGPDGTTLASASDDLSLWEVSSGRLRQVISQPSWVTAVAFRPGADEVATGHDDGIIRLWNAESGRLVREWVDHERPISALAFDSAGSRLASAAEDKAVYVWQFDEDKPRHRLLGHTDRVHTLAWLPGSDHLVTTGWDTTVRLWDSVTLKPLFLLNYHAPQVTALAVSRDGVLLASADSNDTVYVWDVKEARLRSRLEGPQETVQCLAFRGDGRQLAAGGCGRVIKLWDIASSQFSSPASSAFQVEQSGLRQKRTCLALSPDGRWLANLEGTSLQLWDTVAEPLRWHEDEGVLVHSLAYSPNGRWLAAGRDDAQIHLRNVADGRPLGTLAHKKQSEPVTALAVAPDSQQLASASATSTAVWIWDVSSREPALLIPDALDGCTVEGLAFHPQGRRLAVGGIDWLATGGSDGAISIWDLEERCEIATFPGGVTGLAFHPSGDRLASATLARSICVWNLETGQLAEEWMAGQHNPLCVVYSPDGRWLVSGGEDRTIRFWDSHTGRLIAATDLTTQPQTLQFSPDGRFLYTGNSNRSYYQMEVSRLVADDAEPD